jgi:hypothetical protein
MRLEPIKLEIFRETAPKLTEAQQKLLRRGATADFEGMTARYLNLNVVAFLQAQYLDNG